jgi:hypothetical protein
MRQRTIHFYKIQWSHHSEQEATWETEEFLRSKYREFLPPLLSVCTSFVGPLYACNHETRFPLRGGL